MTPFLRIFIPIFIFSSIPIFLFSQNFNIKLYTPATGSTIEFTSIGDSDEYNPDFSSDGSQIVFDVVGPSASLGHALWIGNLSTGAYGPLAGADGGNDGVWSPDDSQIAFDRTPLNDHNIYIVPSGGGTPTLIIADGIDATWSHNGKFIAYTQFSTGLLSVYDVDKGSSLSLDIDGINPAWSGNGKKLAYSFMDDIYVVSMNNNGTISGTPINLTADGRSNSQPTWSRNKKTIYYHSGMGTNFDIYAIPVSGGSGSYVTGTLNPEYDPNYAPGGPPLMAYSGYSSITPPTTLTVSTHFSNSFEIYPTLIKNQATISFNLIDTEFVLIEAYDQSGRKLETIIREHFSKGLHQVNWQPKNSYQGPLWIIIKSKSQQKINKILKY